MSLASRKRNTRLTLAFLAALSLVPAASGAISGNMVWELRQGGSASNGGGFRNNLFQSPPSAPTVTPSGTGGTVAAATYFCVVTYGYSVNAGDTPISGQTSVTVSGATASFTVTHPTDPGNSATWSLYVATATGGPYFPQGTGLAIGSNRVVTTTPPTSGTQPAGTDRTLSTSPFVAVDNAAITATTTGANSNILTFTAGYTPTGADVGNVFHATGGTNITAGFYEITAVTSTTWTVTGAANLTTAGGAGSAITGNMGGAINHPATLGGVASSNNCILIKYSATPYSFTNAGNNVSTGTVTFSQDGLAVVGYDTTRTLFNTDANRPILQPANNSLTLFNCNTRQRFVNLDFQNPTPNTATVGLQIGGNGLVKNCRFNTYQQWALQLGVGSCAMDCEFISCGSSNLTLYMNGASQAIRCIAKSCSTAGGSAAVFGASFASGCSLVDCIAVGTVGSGPAFVGGDLLVGCIAYGGGSNSNAHGFTASSICTRYESCVSYGNSGSGFTSSTSSRTVILSRCYTGANTVSGIVDTAIGPDQRIACGTLSGDPFTNAAGYDFSTNTTAGAGAALRGLTITFPGGTTTSYPDAGAAQSASSAGNSGGKKVGPGGGKVGMLDPRSLFPFPRSRSVITRKAG